MYTRKTDLTYRTELHDWMHSISRILLNGYVTDVYNLVKVHSHGVFPFTYGLH